MLLFTSDDTQSVACSQLARAQATPHGAVCSARTDAAGGYAFDGCACAAYTVQPRPVTAAGSALSLLPASASVALGHRSAVVPDFQVKGFGISGKVGVCVFTESRVTLWNIPFAPLACEPETMFQWRVRVASPLIE